METLIAERCAADPEAELRLGIASWDDGSRTANSIKFAWRDRRGHVARGGELPVQALPQMLALAAEHGYLDLSVIRNACFDPGHYVERQFTHSDFGGTDPEPLFAWQARAVLAALGTLA